MWKLCQWEPPQTAAPDFLIERPLQPLANRCQGSARLTCAEPGIATKAAQQAGHLSPGSTHLSLLLYSHGASFLPLKILLLWVSGFQGSLVEGSHIKEVGNVHKGGNRPEMGTELKQYGVTKKA